MKAHEFLTKVRKRGGYADQARICRVTNTVLGVLAQRLPSDEADDLGAHLPHGIDKWVATDEPVRQNPFGTDEFHQRVAAALRGTPATAESDAKAVLSIVGEAITADQLDQLLSELDPDYAPLFGKPEPVRPAS